MNKFLILVNVVLGIFVVSNVFGLSGMIDALNTPGLTIDPKSATTGSTIQVIAKGIGSFKTRGYRIIRLDDLEIVEDAKMPQADILGGVAFEISTKGYPAGVYDLKIADEKGSSIIVDKFDITYSYKSKVNNGTASWTAGYYWTEWYEGKFVFNTVDCGTAGSRAGNYEVNVRKSNCTNTGRLKGELLLGGFVAEADVKFATVPGKDDECGLAFRFSDDNDKNSFYYFRINGSKNYCLGKLLNGEWQRDIQPWTVSAYLNPDDKVNMLKVVCFGQYIELYANDKLLCRVIDKDQPLSGGTIGLAVGAGDHTEQTYGSNNSLSSYNWLSPNYGKSYTSDKADVTAVFTSFSLSDIQ